MWLARIEIKEVTHGTESRRISTRRAHTSTAIILTFDAYFYLHDSSYRSSFNIKFVTQRHILSIIERRAASCNRG